MSDEGDALDPGGELSGSRTLLLCGEARMWVIESGSVALFWTQILEGEPAGQRRFVRRVTAGQALFRLPPAVGAGPGLFGVAVQPAVLREIHLDPAQPGARSRELDPLVDEWIAHLSSVIPASPELQRPARGAAEERLELEDGQDLTAARDRVIWARPLEGRLEVLGDERELLSAGEVPLPLGPGVWMRARGPARVEVSVTSGQERIEDWLAGLARLQRTVLEHLARRDAQDEARELERVRDSSRQQSRRLQGALSDLASVLDPRPEEVAVEDPLLASVRLIGRELGVAVRAPAVPPEADAKGDALDAIARASHLRFRRVRLAGRWWRRDGGPLLAFEALEDGLRPIALLRRWRGYVAVDPQRGTRRTVRRRLAARIAAEAIHFSRPLPERAIGLREMARFALRGRRPELVVVLCVGLAATLLGMLVPLGTARIMDHAIPSADRRALLEIGLGLGAAVLGQAVYRLSEGIVLLRLGVGCESELQSALWDRLLRLRPSFFRRYSSGDLQSRVMAVDDMGRDISGTVLTTLFSSFLSLLNLGLLWFLHPPLSVLAVGVAAVVILTTTSFGAALRHILRKLLELDGRFFGLEVQLIQAVGKLRVAGAERRAFTHWLGLYASQLRLMSRTLFLSDASRVVNVVITPLCTLLLFVFALDDLGAERGAGLTLGGFLAFNAAFGTFLSGVTSLSDTVVGFLDTAAKVRRIEPILAEPPEIDQHKADPGRLNGQIALNGVQFRYRAEGPLVLEDISLEAEPGEFVALVGPSGSGKSTLLRLLLGFEAPSAGTVAFDGQDLSALDVLAVRRQLGVVLQHGRLSAGSIFENIASGGLTSLDEAWAAAEDAGFGDEVREMPMGMHTIVSEGGGNLSGGQRQRLLIARALATRPRILLLDEATSALDNRTQAVVSQSLERLHVTRIVVAHRLSTIRQADRIYVLEAGRVVERGSFAELLAAGGLFARMMARQLA